MRLWFEKVPRLPRVPRAVALALSAWGLYVVGGIALGATLGRPLDTCLFYAATGRPCPGCGGTRAVLSLVQGRWIEAWQYNPLITAVILILGAGLALRALTGRLLRVEGSTREGIAFLVLLGLAVLANWAWLLRTLA